MKKIFTSLAFLFVLCLAAQPLFSNNYLTTTFLGKDGKNKQLKIVSNRKSGDIQLRFTAEKAGLASIKILTEAGEVVLQQTSNASVNVNTVSLKNAMDLKEGLYLVQLVLNNETSNTKFLLWK